MARFFIIKSLIYCFIFCTSLSYANESKQTQLLPTEELAAFTQIYQYIKHSYVEPVDDKHLIEGAIRGMLSSLDDYSSYLDKNELEDLRASTDGLYDGLGIDIGIKNDQIVIQSVEKDTPAFRGGIKIDDIIVKVNHQSVASLGTKKAIGKMRGTAGESIHLSIKRSGQENIIEFDLIRETLNISSISVYQLEPGFWHAKVKIFQRDTGYELSKYFYNIIRQGKQVAGIVLDLRNNPGGILTSAIDIADLILKDGLIVSTAGRIEDSQQKFYARPGGVFEEVPIVVLINQGSASASEIVAAAIQDHKRALILGQTSFGKGSVQSILPIHKDSAIKLTTSRYYTPNGRSIQGKGVRPDIVLKKNSHQKKKQDEFELKQAMRLLVEQSQSIL